ncbi:uncharacterized protein TNCV_1859821 [Trichonephila clavipes]|nr:uncharacterized protein TNCV_1859821 [Trichonephila clavipes]
MEMKAALTFVEKIHITWIPLQYVLSDGDCKTFNYLCEKKVYGPDIVIKKEECINHVSKRLGTALRSTVKDCRAQGYFEKQGDVNAMKTAIYATLLHSISTDAKPQHAKCPAEKTHGVSTNLRLLMVKT